MTDTKQMQWFFVQTHSGYEQRAHDGLLVQAEQAELSELLGKIIIPMEQIVEVVNGETRQRSRKFYPGYMLVQLVLTDPMWHVVKNTPRIIGFVGNASNPVPIPQAKIDQILSQMEGDKEKPKAVLSFQEGDSIRVINGPFKNFNGVVEEVNLERQRVRVLVSIFGRATPVELDFIQVESISS